MRAAGAVVGRAVSRASRRVCAPVAARLRRDGRPGDAGSAIVEFLGLALLLLVPIVYVVLTLARLEAAVYAAQGGAREAARVITRAEDDAAGLARAGAAVELAFADQGFDVDAADALHVVCDQAPCVTPGGRVVVEVRVDVPLPGVPDAVRGSVPAQVPVVGRFVAVVDEFRAVVAP